MHLLPRLKHETTAIEGVPTTSELSQRICEDLTGYSVRGLGVRTAGLPGQLLPWSPRRLKTAL